MSNVSQCHSAGRSGLCDWAVAFVTMIFIDKQTWFRFFLCWFVSLSLSLSPILITFSVTPPFVFLLVALSSSYILSLSLLLETFTLFSQLQFTDFWLSSADFFHLQTTSPKKPKEKKVAR